MAIWTFLDYCEPSGRNPVRSWFAEQPEDAQGHMSARLSSMTALQKWRDKWASSYKGFHPLIELRMGFNKVQYRPLGFRRYEDNEKGIGYVVQHNY